MAKNYNRTKLFWAKLIIWVLAVIPGLRLVYLGISDGLGANPVEFIERSTGSWSLIFLMITLSVSPLQSLLKQPWISGTRRLLGLWMLTYAVLHLTAYLWFDFAFEWPDIFKDIVKHPYVFVGVLAFILTIILGITSNQIAMRTLKKKWKPLHQLVYIIAILGLLHFWWLVKKDVTEPVIFTIVFLVLMSFRLLKAQSK